MQCTKKQDVSTKIQVKIELQKLVDLDVNGFLPTPK